MLRWLDPQQLRSFWSAAEGSARGARAEANPSSNPNNPSSNPKEAPVASTAELPAPRHAHGLVVLMRLGTADVSVAILGKRCLVRRALPYLESVAY